MRTLVLDWKRKAIKHFIEKLQKTIFMMYKSKIKIKKYLILLIFFVRLVYTRVQWFRWSLPFVNNKLNWIFFYYPRWNWGIRLLHRLCVPVYFYLCVWMYNFITSLRQSINQSRSCRHGNAKYLDMLNNNNRDALDLSLSNRVEYNVFYGRH